MSEHRPGQWQLCRHQERGPINRMESEDVLSDHVDVRRPVLRIHCFVRLIADPGHISGQGIEPDVEHVGGIVRQRNAPFECSAANGQIPQPTFHERRHFVSSRFRTYELRFFFIVIK